MWKLIPSLQITAGGGTNGDQRILRRFRRVYPKLVGSLPQEWDISFKNGYQGDSSNGYGHATPEEVLYYLKSGAGMLHFNGGGESSDSYFENKMLVRFNDTFGLSTYYINMPWSWARFTVESNRRDDAFYLPTITSV